MADGMITVTRGNASLATDASAFLRHRAFHQWHHKHECKRQHGEYPKAIEIGQGGCLLLAQILKCLQGQMLRGNRIAVLLKESRLSLLKKGMHCGVKGIRLPRSIWP